MATGRENGVKMQSGTARHYIPFTLMVGLLLGSTLVVSRFSLGQFATQTYVTMRLLVGSLSFFAMYWIFRIRPWPRNRGLWMRAGIYGLVGTALTMTAYTQSLRYQSSGITSLLATLSPIETALLAHFFLKGEPLRKRHFIGALLAFAGTGLLLMRGESGLSDLARADWRGYAWALLGGLTNSVGLVYARKYLSNDDPMVVTSIRIWIGAGVICAITAFTEGIDLRQVQWSGFSALLYAGIIGTFLAFLAYQAAIKRYGATRASQAEYFVPLVATGLGVVFLNELVTGNMLIGMALILFGLAVFDRGIPWPSGLRRRPVTE